MLPLADPAVPECRAFVGPYPCHTPVTFPTLFATLTETTVPQIMKAHKQEDSDRAGKRIASEAGRRYIMTAAGTSGGTASGSRASGASGGAAGGRSESSTAGEIFAWPLLVQTCDLRVPTCLPFLFLPISHGGQGRLSKANRPRNGRRSRRLELRTGGR